MSFTSWLARRFSTQSSPSGRDQRRRPLNGRRLVLEGLEDRRLFAFAPAVDYSTGANPQAIVTADFNNDGRLDLVTANHDAGTVSVLLGDGQGGYGAANQFAAGSNPRSLVVSDFDNDGNLDLAILSNLVMTMVRVLPGNGDGTLRTPFDTAIHAGGLALAAGDFNADGRSDLVYTLADSTSWDNAAVAVLLGDGLGGFAHLNAVELGGTWSPVGLAVGDVNADGKLDAVTANDAGTVSVLLGNGDGTLSYAAGSSNFTTGPSPRAVAIGDFTGDGIYDVVTAGQTVDVLPGLGDGTFGPPIRHSANSIGMTSVATPDFNGDGNLDVVTADPGAGTVSVLLNNGNGTLRYAGAFAIGTAPAAVTVGDFNGDGRPDVAVANAGSNNMSVLLNDGNWEGTPVVPPSLSISDTTVTEGNTGTVNATFTVNLSTVSAVDVTVQYATANYADGYADPRYDYTATSGTVIIPAGQISQTFTVAVLGDRIPEATGTFAAETFAVNLSSATNAAIGDGQGIGTILDDEPRISISDVSKSEGKKNQTNLFTFTVTLSVAYDQPVTASYRTVNGTATTSDKDYVSRTGTLTFAPGETTKTITIEVKGDTKKEANEIFYLDLFGLTSNALFTKNRGMGTILNDD